MDIDINKWFAEEQVKVGKLPKSEQFRSMEILNHVTVAINAKAKVTAGQLLFVRRFVFERIIENQKLTREEQDMRILQLATFINSCR